ncbi:Wzz/FepE/Etk N-terminal domain-containing protein [Candidatus Pelagibacter ubique]|nr:Wzz/FepE/Etk N-terminal domain-containing protein [Candidatus Pelagibacter ubique]
MIKKTSAYEDEIDLIYLIKDIWRRKLMIISITIISTLIGFSLVYKNNQKPPIFEISLYLQPNENSEFVKFVNINNILLSKNLSEHIITNEIIFQKFINQLLNYEILISALENNIYVQKKISKLPLDEQKKMVSNYARSFTLKKNSNTNYTFKFQWHDEIEGILILNDFFDLMKSTLENNVINNLEDILKTIKVTQFEENLKRIDYLVEQKEIAKEYEIEINEDLERIDNLLKQNKIAQDLKNKLYNTQAILNSTIQNNLTEQVTLPVEPFYYLRGVNTIEKEISHIKNRKHRDEIFLFKEINSLKNNSDTAWVQYNLPNPKIELLVAFNNKKILIISIILGLILGIICALFLNLNQAQISRKN